MNRNSRWFLPASVFVWMLFSAFLLFPQNPSAVPNAEAKEAQQRSAKSLIEPVFPDTNKTIIHIEGEKAVSTNFTSEPTINYGCSGGRAIQLNRPGTAAVTFYADFAFFAEEAGDYLLLYGGTPPGPNDELHPSYASPFKYSIDGGEPVSVYEETAEAVEDYSPPFYFVSIGTVTLSQGKHTMRITVTDKRRFDNRYFFYLDVLYLIRTEAGKPVRGEQTPKIFPKQTLGVLPHYPFKTIDDYLIAIRDNPSNPNLLYELSLLYTLLGDNLNALKFLNKLILIEPGHEKAKVLAAKNRIWKGEIAEGLAQYRKILAAAPERTDLWLEAGKLAAWTNRYDESIALFLEALKAHPDSIDLKTNLALSYLWAGKPKEFADMTALILSESEKDPVLLKEAAESYGSNGYPEGAVQIYKQAIQKYPSLLENYLLLQDTYVSLGKNDEAASIRTDIEKTFVASDTLDRYLSQYKEKQGMKNEIIAEFQSRLAENPDNLELRELLAQTYFWNGRRTEAIDELLNIIINHTYRTIEDMEKEAVPLYDFLNTGSIIGNTLALMPKTLSDVKNTLSAQASKLTNAIKALDEYKVKLEAAKEKGQTMADASQTYLDAVNKEQGTMNLIFASAKRYVDVFSNILAHMDRRTAALSGIKETAKQKQEAFKELTKNSNWRWDRDSFFLELNITSKKGLDLALHIMGKVYLVERRFQAFEEIFSKLAATQAEDPDIQTHIAIAALWANKNESVKKAVETVPFSSPLMESIRELFPVLSLEPLTVLPLDFFAPSEEELKTLLARFDEIAKHIPELRNKNDDMQRTVHEVLYEKMIHAIYRNQESTVEQRNQLGEYYLKENDLDSGIRQFRQVLDIDPNNIRGIYRLGSIYQWKQDWNKAMEYYKNVYTLDPFYENTVSLHNKLAGEHAHSVSLHTNYFTDPYTHRWQSDASTLLHLNTFIGVEAAYGMDVVTLRNQTTYLVHDVRAFLPLTFPALALSVHPGAGIALVESKSTTASSSPADGFDYARYVADPSPYAHVDILLGLGRYLFLTGSYRWGQYEETYAPFRESRTAHSFDISFSVNLGFINLFPFNGISFRTYGKGDAISDSNFILTAAQDILVPVFQGGNPYFSIQVYGNFTFQNGFGSSIYQYYSPPGVLIAGGGFTASTWIAFAQNTLGISFRGFVANYDEQILTPENLKRRLKLEGELSVNLTLQNAEIACGGVFSAAYNYAANMLNFQPSWDYSSLSVRLAYTVKLPDYILP